MKICFNRSKLILVILFATRLIADAEPVTNRLSDTNIISFHFAELDMQLTMLDHEKNVPPLENIRQAPEILIGDDDIVSWNATNHEFVITPSAAQRLLVKCKFNVLPFIINNHGRPMLLGIYDSLIDSNSHAGFPLVFTDQMMLHPETNAVLNFEYYPPSKDLISYNTREVSVNIKLARKKNPLEDARFVAAVSELLNRFPDKAASASKDNGT